MRFYRPRQHQTNTFTIRMSDGWQAWLDWQRTVAPDNEVEMKALEDDHGSYLGYIRAVGHRREEVELADPIVYFPAQYTKKPLLRPCALCNTGSDDAAAPQH